MADVTLHLKDEATGLCAVCGANLRQRVSRWWLVNCWTGDPRHYKAQETNLPGESVRPCGALDVARLKTAQVLRSKAPPGFEGAYFGCEDDCAPD